MGANPYHSRHGKQLPDDKNDKDGEYASKHFVDVF